MSCPEIEKIALDDLSPTTAAHIAECAACRERREKLAHLLAVPSSAPPPPDVLPRLLAKIDAQITREVAQPIRVRSHRRLAAALFASALVGTSLILALAGSETQAKEKRLEALVVESEWRALGYSSERELRAEMGGGK